MSRERRILLVVKLTCVARVALNLYFFVASYLQDKHAMRQHEENISKILNRSFPAPPERKVHPRDYYNIIEEKALFGNPVKVEEKIPQDPPSINTQEELRKLTLVGIVCVGAKGQALIRHAQNKEEYFCTGGEKIGTFTVEKVLKDKVILSTEGEQLELALR